MERINPWVWFAAVNAHGISPVALDYSPLSFVAEDVPIVGRICLTAVEIGGAKGSMSDPIGTEINSSEKCNGREKAKKD
jgi:hypothetical protein